MDFSGTKLSYPESTGGHFDRAKEVQAFDDSKAGVKGLIDAGVVKVPTIFIRPQDELSEDLKSPPVEMQVPVIDLGNIGERYSRERVVNEVRRASEEWGFFQVVNHGIPLNVLEEMIDGIRMFHEEDPEIKGALYSRDRTKKVRFESNHDLYKSTYVNWRDSLNISMLVSDHLDPDEIPKTCSNGEEDQEQIKPEYDRKSELKAFDDTKTGVKGLVDAGVTKIPRIFIHDKSQLNDISTTSSAASLFSVPIIDIEGVDQVNHGIAKHLMDDMIDGVRRFHEQDTEVKKGFYSRDETRKFIYNSNFDLYTGPALIGGTPFLVLWLLSLLILKNCPQYPGIKQTSKYVENEKKFQNKPGHPLEKTKHVD
ncbi:hypothetical protein RHSIM_Rhsim04G0186800 [Rhododendron simsii]|uniref:Non-haem dioxygenase N-terminal domain-containing protein n=1 Tax=Rhododendron simsii TaxID=118357 RepID=A0A834H1S5_RHOSS|nr:hypothetical protein RHSIM_Rhsim04G0186800 [Rhododendron simsii]